MRSALQPHDDHGLVCACLSLCSLPLSFPIVRFRHASIIYISAITTPIDCVRGALPKATEIRILPAPSGEARVRVREAGRRCPYPGLHRQGLRVVSPLHGVDRRPVALPVRLAVPRPGAHGHGEPRHAVPPGAAGDAPWWEKSVRQQGREELQVRGRGRPSSAVICPAFE